ncbi:MAG: ABC transporter permease [Ruminococcaceae bacterium]|nr:ABC transporter permease [Oscillospiraceae bacterium]
MYVIKNALKCIARAKGRSVLIGIIALVIATSACLGLSIRQAAQNAKETTLNEMEITANISVDRRSMMQNIKPDEDGFDRDAFKDKMGETSSLTLEEYKKYAQADAVEDFYYTITAYFNGSDDLEPVTDEEETEETEQTESKNNMPEIPSGNRGGMRGIRASGDFTVVGYSSDLAMTDFKNNTASVTSGTVFKEDTAKKTCIISEELAAFNNLKTGSKITLINANNDTENYEFEIVGIYKAAESNEFSQSAFGTSQDPANRIYVSARALSNVIKQSQAVSTTKTTSDGREYETALNGTINATYTFADSDSFAAFETQARKLGLDETYTISSPDLNSFEERITPLNTLSSMAGWFLLVILIIGAVILVVLNIFNVRERKYEIGVLTAMGMKKRKVAVQFVCEILVITMIAVIIGAGIGAVSSVPVTNTLLESQTQSQTENAEQLKNNFGRDGNITNNTAPTPPDKPNNFSGKMDKMIGGAVDYITEVDSAMNLTVVFQMLLIGLGLTLVASGISVLFVMRYDPLKILANRD